MTVGSFLWGSPVKKAATSITLVASCITAVAAAAPVVEPYIAAHRGYVRDVASIVDSKTKLAQAESQRVIRDLQVEQAEGKRDQTEESMFKWSRELEKATDEQAKQLIRERIRDLANTKSRLESQIRTLNEVRGR